MSPVSICERDLIQLFPYASHHGGTLARQCLPGVLYLGMHRDIYPTIPHILYHPYQSPVKSVHNYLFDMTILVFRQDLSHKNNNPMILYKSYHPHRLQEKNTA